MNLLRQNKRDRSKIAVVDERPADLKAHLLSFVVRQANITEISAVHAAIFRGHVSVNSPREIRFVFRPRIVGRNVKL